MLFPLVLLSGCGIQHPQNELSKVQSNPYIFEQNLNFSEWCTNWNLNCPEGEPLPFPTESDQWDKNTWEGLGRLAAAGLFSPTEFDVPASEVNNPLFSEIFTSLQLEEWYEFLKGLIEERKLSRIYLNKSGSLNVVFNDTQQYHNESGLGVAVDTAVTLTPTGGGTVNFTGVSLSDLNETTSKTLQSLSFEKNTVQLKLEEDYKVSSVHTDFLLNDALGDTPELSLPGNIDFLGLTPYLAPLLNWAQSQGIQASLPKNFFEEALNTYQNIAKPPYNNTIINALRKLSNISSGGNNAIDVNLVRGKTLQCKLESQRAVTLNISDTFGLRSLRNKDSETVEIRTYGIDAKVLGFKLSIKRMDLKKDSVTIYDIPVIRKFTVPISNEDVNNINCK